MAAEGLLAEPGSIRSPIFDEVEQRLENSSKMGGRVQVGAFAVGARAGTVVKQMDTTGGWRMLLGAFRSVWPMEAR